MNPHGNDPVPPLALSPDAAARTLDISKRTIYRLLEQGAITARRCGARTLIEYSSLQAYLASRPEFVSGAPMPNSRHTRK
jgi:excisionase family DNA binding protein